MVSRNTQMSFLRVLTSLGNSTSSSSNFCLHVRCPLLFFFLSCGSDSLRLLQHLPFFFPLLYAPRDPSVTFLPAQCHLVQHLNLHVGTRWCFQGASLQVRSNVLPLSTQLNQTNPVVPTDGYAPLPCWLTGGFDCPQARARGLLGYLFPSFMSHTDPTAQRNSQACNSQ